MPMSKTAGRDCLAKHLGKVFLALTALVTTAAEAECLNSLRQETPTSSFTLQGPVAIHHSTGLMWMRCSLGQVWQPERSTCVQDANTSRLYNWSEALTAAHNLDLAGHRDWRLPNKNELSSIVERACTGPAINEEVFPDTPLASFWTSTPALALLGYGWRVGFTRGDLVPHDVNNALNLRLVRDP